MDKKKKQVTTLIVYSSTVNTLYDFNAQSDFGKLLKVCFNQFEKLSEIFASLLIKDMAIFHIK